MLEACHRGFHDIVEFLIKANANLRYIPSSKVLNSSLFMTAPPQTALAESARCGFLRIVEVRQHEFEFLRTSIYFYN
jgi:hypothetical protein